MERKIGEIFEFGGERYQCLPERNICDDCAFKHDRTCKNSKGIRGECQRVNRQKDSVIFKKLEKVGEPITIKGRTFQKLILYNYSCANCVFNIQNKECYKNSYIDGPCPDNEIWVEIKQTKEDMEENHKAEDTLLARLVGRYVNNLIDYETFEEAVKELYSDKKDSKLTLKEFDLEAAKAGKPVCTRDGRKARIICFDLKNNVCPIVAVVEENNMEVLYYYDTKGLNCYKRSEIDLMMLPEKKEGWVNIVRGSNGSPHMGRGIFQSKEEAENAIKAFSDNLIDTVKINWSE